MVERGHHASRESTRTAQETERHKVMAVVERRWGAGRILKWKSDRAVKCGIRRGDFGKTSAQVFSNLFLRHIDRWSRNEGNMMQVTNGPG